MARTENLIPISEIQEERFFTDLPIDNFLPPVLNQLHYTNFADGGQCFSVAFVESIQAKRNFASVIGKVKFGPQLSVQQLVDAMSPKPIDYVVRAIQYTTDFGLVSTEDYLAAPSMEGIKLRNVVGLEQYRTFGCRRYRARKDISGFEQRVDIINSANTYGPLVVDMMVTQEMLSYRSGILTGKNYEYGKGGPKTHAALAVGHGITKSNKEFWICRNNWGERYADKGIFRIDADLVMEAYSPIVTETEYKGLSLPNLIHKDISPQAMDIDQAKDVDPMDID